LRSYFRRPKTNRDTIFQILTLIMCADRHLKSESGAKKVVCNESVAVQNYEIAGDQVTLVHGYFDYSAAGSSCSRA